MLIPDISPDEIAVLENGYETVLDNKKHRVEQPDYRLAGDSQRSNTEVICRAESNSVEPTCSPIGK